MKSFIDDVFCLWDTNKEEIENFIEQANSYHPTIKFTAEVSQLETTFLDTTVYKGERFAKESILDVHTHYKPTETFQYTNYNSCHPAGIQGRSQYEANRGTCLSHCFFFSGKVRFFEGERKALAANKFTNS